MLFNCKDNSFFSIMESFLIFFCILHANLRVFVEIELGNHLFGGGKSLKVGFQTPADR